MMHRRVGSISISIGVWMTSRVGRQIPLFDVYLDGIFPLLNGGVVHNIMWLFCVAWSFGSVVLYFRGFLWYVMVCYGVDR